jgi:hypothetical protein
MIESDITGSIIWLGGEISPYMDNPSVIVCATVKAVACHITGFSFGFKRKRLKMKSIWSNPSGRICVNPNCKYIEIASVRDKLFTTTCASANGIKIKTESKKATQFFHGCFIPIVSSIKTKF